MASARIHLPCLGLGHPPKLHEAVVSRGNDQGKSGVERDPIDATVVALEHELDYGVGVPEHVGLVLVGALHLVLEGHGGRRGVFLPQPRDIPNTDGLVERGRDDQVILGVELRAHGVVVMAGHGAYLAGLGAFAAMETTTYSMNLHQLVIIRILGGKDSRFCQFHIRMVSANAVVSHCLDTDVGAPLTVIRAAHYPWQLVVEEDGADIV